MAKFKKSKKPLIAIGAVLVLGAIGFTVAYNATQFQFNNEFPLGYFKTETTEDFTSPTNWTPCTETPKIFTVKNKGNIAAKVRVGAEEVWTAANGGHLSALFNGERVAQINFSETDKWELRDGYYYAKNALAPGEELEFMHSVTMNCNVDFGTMDMCTETASSTSCNTRTASPYGGAEYHLKLTAQYLQDDNTIAWEDVYPIVPDDEDDWVDPTTFATLKSGLVGTIRGTVMSGGNASAFKRSQVLPTDATLTKLSTDDSAYEAWAWYDSTDDAVYWYSVADALTLNANDGLSGLIMGWTLRDISGFRDFDVSKVSGISGWFCSENIVDDWSPISHWKLTSMTGIYGGIFNCTYSIYDDNGKYVRSEFVWDDYSFASHWDVSNVRSISGAFSGNTKATSLKGLENWDVSNVTSLTGAFSGASGLQNLDGLENWNVSNLQYMDGAFSGCTNLTDISALSGWGSKLGNLQTANGAFSGAEMLGDISPLGTWRTPNANAFGSTFSGLKRLKDISALSNWDVHNVNVFGSMFYNTSVTDVSPLASWNVSNGTSFNEMFEGAKVTNASALNDWNVSGTATTKDMFDKGLATYPTWYQH
jgi:surface protein